MLSSLGTIIFAKVRVENVENPSDYVEAVLSRVKEEYLAAIYKLSSWSDATDFLEKLAAKRGKLLKVFRDYFAHIINREGITTV